MILVASVPLLSTKHFGDFGLQISEGIEHRAWGIESKHSLKSKPGTRPQGASPKDDF
jgi:hypothetical protein